MLLLFNTGKEIRKVFQMLLFSTSFPSVSHPLQYLCALCPGTLSAVHSVLYCNLKSELGPLSSLSTPLTTPMARTSTFPYFPPSLSIPRFLFHFPVAVVQHPHNGVWHAKMLTAITSAAPTRGSPLAQIHGMCLRIRSSSLFNTGFLCCCSHCKHLATGWGLNRSQVND